MILTGTGIVTIHLFIDYWFVEFCSIQLYSPEGKCIATCDAKAHQEPVVKRRHEESHILANWTLQESHRIALCYLRICLIVAMAVIFVSSPLWFRMFYLLSMGVDFVSR